MPEQTLEEKVYYEFNRQKAISRARDILWATNELKLQAKLAILVLVLLDTGTLSLAGALFPSAPDEKPIDNALLFGMKAGLILHKSLIILTHFFVYITLLYTGRMWLRWARQACWVAMIMRIFECGLAVFMWIPVVVMGYGSIGHSAVLFLVMMVINSFGLWWSHTQLRMLLDSIDMEIGSKSKSSDSATVHPADELKEKEEKEDTV